MALTPETGTASSSADTFVTITEVAAFALSRGLAWPGAAGADVVVQEAAIRAAADYLKNESRFRYRGTRVSAAQRMPFPRSGVSLRYGPSLPSSGVDSIPWQVRDAQCLLACRIVAGATSGQLISLEPDLDRGGAIKREKVDVIETEYFDGAPAEKLIPAVMGILEPLLRGSSMPNPDQVTAFIPERAEETPFAPNDFDFR